MTEKRRLPVLGSPDAAPPEPTPRTLMPEILPTPGPRRPDGGARQRILHHLDRLRAAAAPKSAALDGDAAVDPDATELR